MPSFTCRITRNGEFIKDEPVSFDKPAKAEDAALKAVKNYMDHWRKNDVWECLVTITGWLDHDLPLKEPQTFRVTSRLVREYTAQKVHEKG